MMQVVSKILVWCVLCVLIGTDGAEDQMYIVVTDENGNIIDQHKINSNNPTHLAFPSRADKLQMRTTNQETDNGTESDEIALPNPSIIDDFGNDIAFADRNLLCSSLHPPDCGNMAMLKENEYYIPIPNDDDSNFYTEFRRSMDKQRDIRDMKELSQQFFNVNNDVTKLRIQSIYNLPIFDARNEVESIPSSNKGRTEGRSLLKSNVDSRVSDRQNKRQKEIKKQKTKNIFAPFRPQLYRVASATKQSLLKTGLTYKRPMLKVGRQNNRFKTNYKSVNTYEIPKNKREALEMAYDQMQKERKRPTIPYMEAAAYHVISEARNQTQP